MRVWQYTSLKLDDVGGVEKHIASLCHALQSHGLQTRTGIQPPSDWLEDTSEPTIVHTHGDLLIDPRIVFRCRRSPNFRWVHVCHGTTVGRLIACGEIPKISGTRGIARDFAGARVAKAVVAVSRQSLWEARRYFGLKAEACVIPNGADPGIFMPLQTLSADPRLIFLGRTGDRVKNLDSLIKAVQIVHDEISNVELWAAPGVHTRGRHPDFVKNLGPLSGKDLFENLARCRSLVLSSFYEGDPLVLHEAKAMGLPILVSRIPQLVEALRDYPNAFFFDPHEPTDMAKAIRHVLFETPNLKPAPLVRTWDQVAKEFESFYEKLF